MPFSLGARIDRMSQASASRRTPNHIRNMEKKTIAAMMATAHFKPMGKRSNNRAIIGAMVEKFYKTHGSSVFENYSRMYKNLQKIR